MTFYIYSCTYVTSSKDNILTFAFGVIYGCKLYFANCYIFLIWYFTLLTSVIKVH